MEKLTILRLKAIAQIAIPPTRFARFVRTTEMCLADWQGCLEMASYCGLDVSDYLKSEMLENAGVKLSTLETSIEGSKILDRSMAQFNKEGGYLKRFERQLMQCKEQRRLILRLDCEGITRLPTYAYYLHGEMIARLIYGGGRMTDQWELSTKLDKNIATFDHAGYFDRVEHAEYSLKHLAKADFQGEF